MELDPLKLKLDNNEPGTGVGDFVGGLAVFAVRPKSPFEYALAPSMTTWYRPAFRDSVKFFA